MKIAMVAYLHGAGGAERQITMLANEMANKGHEVFFIVLADYNVKYDISKRVKVYDLTYAEKKMGIKILNRYYALKDTLIDIKPDITIHFWLQSAYFCAFMKKGISGKIIYAERGDPGDKEYSGMLGVIRSISFYRMNGFVFQSEGARNYFKKDIVRKSIIIQNALSIPDNLFREPCQMREKKIISVGRLHPQKNHKLLIDAYSLICDKIEDYKIEIYGDGELKKELENYIKNKKLENKIFVFPSRSDIFECMYNASVFILTSEYEGLPNVLMEALALGVPCISTDCKPGGARALIENGVNGYIVPLGDAKSLAMTILEVLCGKKDLDIICRNAQEIRITHSYDRVYEKWNQFLIKVYKNEIS